MQRHESTENYLETILVLHKKNGAVRSIDIVNDIGFTKPSVSIAMKSFREKGYIIMDSSGYITLTNEGMKIAEGVYERHMVVTQALLAIGVSASIAKEDACRIEHDISQETFIKIKEFIKKINS